MPYCYFIFESGKQGQKAAEDVKSHVFHLFQGTWQTQLTLAFDHDHTPYAFLHIDQLILLMKACHREYPRELYLYVHISHCYVFTANRLRMQKREVSKYSCTVGSGLITTPQIQRANLQFLLSNLRQQK